MTPDDYSRLQELFLKLRSLPEDEWAEVLGRDENRALRTEVISLLQVDGESGRFLDLPVSDPVETKEQRPTGNETAEMPKRVGPYRLLQQIGEGGFGTVYLAEQTQPVIRKVAVKLIKPGMDSAQVLARFHAEQQALAMMNHPSIASVFDAGTSEAGTPYFVMELVKGIQIHEFCDQNRLDLHERLSLFTQVCDAVHHAHQKGIIHRDLKPANILVTMGEQHPLAKVIDFGIAKALDTRLTDDTLFTAFGQMIGTLEYMSPEQAEMSAVDVDTRSDVYSLGAVLYQLLTGQPPIAREQILQSGYHDIPRQLRDIEPETPSSRITSNQSAITRVDRKQPIGGLTELSAGDLDWIVMKALAKDRRRRYESALDLSRDIERSQQGLPVDAHPPTLSYRLSKFIWRNRVTASAALVVLTAMIGGIVGLTVGLRNATNAWQQAENSRNLMRDARQQTELKARQLAETVYPELINSAWRAAQQFQVSRAQHLLDTAEPQLRGWEWQLAKTFVEQPGYQLLRTNGGALVQTDVDKNGKWIACVTASGELEVRSTESDKLIQIVSGDFLANTVKFSTQGDRIFVGTVEGQLITLDTKRFTKLNEQQLMSGGIYGIALNQRGDQLAVCTGGSWVKLFEAETRELIQQWKMPTRIGHLIFLTDQERLIGAGLDGRIYRFTIGDHDYTKIDASSSSLGKIVPYGENEVVVSSGERIFAVNLDETSDGELQLLDQNPVLSAFDISSDSSLIVGSGNGQLIRKQREGDSDIIANFGSAVRTINSLSKTRILVSLADGRLLRIQSDSNRDWGSAIQSKTQFDSGVLIPEHFLAILLSNDGIIHSYDIASGKRVDSKKAHSTGWAMDADHQGQQVVTVGEDRNLRCWSLPQLELNFEAELGWGVRDVCIAPGGEWIAAAPPADAKEPSGTIGIWNPRTGKCDRILRGHENWVVTLGTNHSGQLVSGGVNRTCRVWDVNSGETTHVIQSQPKSIASHFAFSSENNELLIGFRDGRVTQWDLTNDKPLSTWSAFGDALSGLAVTQDGRVLATCRSNPNLRIHDFNIGKTVASLDLGVNYVQGFELSVDSQWIGIVGSDGQTKIGIIDNNEE